MWPEAIIPYERPTTLDERVAHLESLLDIVRRPAWHRRAACRGVGTKVFFPDTGVSLKPAKAYCESCPVTRECAEAGAFEKHGVWNGTSARGRTRPKG